MKILYEEIQFCGRCPYCKYDRDYEEYECIKDRNTIDNRLGDSCVDIMKLTPPKWCPLPDEKDWCIVYLL